jgi:hypothetical protein
MTDRRRNSMRRRLETPQVWDSVSKPVTEGRGRSHRANRNDHASIVVASEGITMAEALRKGSVRLERSRHGR